MIVNKTSYRCYAKMPEYSGIFVWTETAEKNC